MQSSKQYYQANKNARVEKTKKTTNVIEQRVDPFKQEASKYSRAGWGSVVKGEDESGESSKKSEKQIKKFKGPADVEIFISDKDQAKIDKRKEMEEKQMELEIQRLRNEEDYER